MERFFLVVVLVVLPASGCFFDTADDVPFGEPGAQELTQQTFDPLFSEDEISTGKTCPATALPGGMCDPVLQDCGPDQVCSLMLDGTRAKSTCVSDEPECGDANEKCPVGFLCVSNECKRFCDLETGLGCDSGEYCDDPFPSTHGVCVEQCQ